MFSANLIFLFAVSVFMSAITCTDTNPKTYGEGICQYPDCTPQLPPPSTYQPYVAPPPPKPISPPPPPPPAPTLPPPAPTGYTPYGVVPPPPAGNPDNCPPPPAAPEGQYCCVQSDSPPSPPPSLYAYVNGTSTSAASPPALPSIFNFYSDICNAVISILFFFAALLHV